MRGLNLTRLPGNSGVMSLTRQNYAGPLDLVPGAAVAYSTRQLRFGYTGPALRVRRSSDNTEQNIGFNGAGELDTTALTAFVGANNGFVTAWYDQSGNGKNVSQATAANQPRIVTSGVVEQRNSRPAITFNGSNNFLGATDTGLPTGAATYASVHHCTNTSLSYGQYRGVAVYGSAAIGTGVFILYGTDPNLGTNSLSVSQYGDGFGINNRLNVSNLHFVLKPAATGTWTTWVNSSLTSSKLMTTNTATNNGANSFTVGSYSQPVGLSSYFQGQIQELLMWPNAHSAHRLALENNINSFYGLY